MLHLPSATALIRCSVIALAAMLLTACGGGGGGDSSASIGRLLSLSGELLIAESSEQDADRQVSGQAVIASLNNDFASAQRLNNPSSVGGYVSARSGFYSNGQVYSADETDFYSIPLLAGQKLIFTIQDAETTPTEAMSVVIRVYSQSNLVSALYGVRVSKPIRLEYEVPSDDEYFVQIETDIFNTAPVLYQIKASRTLATGMELARGSYSELASGDVIVRNQSGEIFQAPGNSDSDVGRLQALRKAAELSQQPNIDRAEPDYKASISSLGVNDLFSGFQWNLEAIGLPEAWQASTGTGTRVAVIDTGFTTDHDELQANVRFDLGYDFIRADTTGDGNGPDADVSEPAGGTLHGAHIAGVIAAETNNASGIAGIAYNAEVIPLRVLNREGIGSAFDIAQAIRYAAGLSTSEGVSLPSPVDVINLSLGLTEDSFVIADAIRAAVAEGVIVIAAAGNDSTGDAFYPANYPEVIGVGSVNHTGFRSLFSNFGDNLSLMAPGGTSSSSIFFDGVDDFILGPTEKDDFDFFIGTSFAAPHVSATAALMKAIDPALSPGTFSSLLNQGLLTDARSSEEFYGKGVINAAKAVSAVGGILADELIAFPESLSFGTSDSRVTLTLSNPGAGAVVINSLSFDVPWLNVAATDTDVNGLGRYAIVINRALVGDDSEAGELEIRFAVNGGLEQIDRVPVFKAGDSAQSTLNGVYVYLVQRDFVNENSTQVPIFRSQFFEQVNGRISFNFDDVPAGNYFLEASTDIDGDRRLFDPGEAVGANRLSSNSAYISLNENRSGLQFEIQFQTVGETTEFTQGFDEQIDRILN